jgi:hypothetical protein
MPLQQNPAPRRLPSLKAKRSEQVLIAVLKRAAGGSGRYAARGQNCRDDPAEAVPRDNLVR